VVGHNWQNFLTGAWTQLHQTWPGHRAIIAALSFFVSEFRYIAAFSNAGGSKLREVSHDAKFRTFWPTPLWKLWEGWARYQLLKLTYDQTSKMAIHCAAAEHGGLIKKKEKSSWVKLKAFPTNGGRPERLTVCMTNNGLVGTNHI